MSFLDSRSRTAPAGFGKPLKRQEDPRLLTGRGCFSDDVNLPGQAHAGFVRSPHAHARIRAIDAAAARAMPGVLAVLTGRDAEADGLAPMPHRPVPTNPNEFPLGGREGSPIFVSPFPVLPSDRARFAGQALAMVIAESAGAAADAAERVAVDYEPLPCVTATRDAIASGAPVVWEEALSGNVCVDSIAGDARAADTAFARAAHVVRLDTWVPRITGVPMEPRAAVGVYDPAAGRYTLHAGSGGSGRLKTDLAEILGVPEHAVRVVARDVGGNYGTRNSSYPEFALVVWAARRLGRPVKWTCQRREAFLTDYQARDLVSTMELALDASGHFLALRGGNVSNVGAHAVTFVPLNKGRELASSVYRLPAAAVRGRAVHSNVSPLAAYRSAGRPQVMFVIERLIDLAARRHGFDRVALRRRNLVPPTAMPYTNPFGIVYDSGDYPSTQDRVLARADWTGFEARRAEARRRGRLRGIGLANYIEIATGAPRERAHVTARPDGWVDVVIGTLSAGQGHETAFPQLVAEWLGVEPSRVRLIQGDTDLVAVGGGSHSGRSMRLGGVVMAKAADRLVAKGARLAAWRLESAVADLEFTNRRFVVRGTDRSVDLFEVAAAAQRRAGGLARPARRRVRRDGEHAVVPLRLGGVRARDRSRDRRDRDRPLHLGGRRRPRDQPADRPRPDPRRHRAGGGPGAVRALRLRPRVGPAPLGHVHGVRDAARRHAAVLRHRDQRGGVDREPAGPARRRRGRHHPRPGRGGQRGGGRARPPGGRAPGDAADPGAGVAGDPGGERALSRAPQRPRGAAAGSTWSGRVA
jgi:carbon-monoxide dehydrogenase large subunit